MYPADRAGLENSLHFISVRPYKVWERLRLQILLQTISFVNQLPPVFCIFVRKALRIILSLNLLGDGLRDALDPKLKR